MRSARSASLIVSQSRRQATGSDFAIPCALAEFVACPLRNSRQPQLVCPRIKLRVHPELIQLTAEHVVINRAEFVIPARQQRRVERNDATAFRDHDRRNQIMAVKLRVSGDRDGPQRSVALTRCRIVANHLQRRPRGEVLQRQPAKPSTFQRPVPAFASACPPDLFLDVAQGLLNGRLVRL
jgi:hypothetical protein